MKFALVGAFCLAAFAAPVVTYAGQVERSSMDVPRWWSDVHVCWPEDVAAGTERVIVGVEGKGSPDHEVFAFRATNWGDRLPQYVVKPAAEMGAAVNGPVVEIAPSRTVGYFDDWFDVFVMPSGTRLTCNAVTEG